MAKSKKSTPQPRYVNRELSWLDFNQRVLDEACDARIPLLERLKFLAITGSNLDEFFMVRVGGLHILRAQRITKRDPAGMTPVQQLKAISQRVHQMIDDQYACFSQIETGLAEQGIQRLSPRQTSDPQQQAASQIFQTSVFPVLTPIATTGSDDFPRVVNHTLNVAVRLAPDPYDEALQERFAVIPLGRSLQRFITLRSEGGYAYLMAEDAVELFVERFFPGEAVMECVAFRVTLNADIAIRDDTASDLLADMRELLAARKTSSRVRLEVADRVSNELLAFLTQSLEVRDEDVFKLPGPLALTDFMQLSNLTGFDRLRYPTWRPLPSPAIDPTAGMFEVIAKQDVLLCHPYDSFDPIVRLVEEAATDPDVLAIKQTLYRTSRDSPIVAALARAALNGKYVTAIVELKARFDEARNIEWAQRLEQAEVQVIYGVKGLKTHSKVLLIVRREPQGVQRYMHFGTGNYNEVTARIYSDVSLLTCDDDLGVDASRFFNAITGYSQPQTYRKLEAAPLGLRARLLEMIEAETERKQQGQQAVIVAKVNSLVDPQIIDALYAASQAGVTVRLNVRGACCLRPGVPGLSENIEVVSIIDRYLEHARILYFFHGGDERMFISSADWMPRNLDRRVELLIPVENTAARQRLTKILEMYFRDNVKARSMKPDGSFERLQPADSPPLAAQQTLYEEAAEQVRQAQQSQPTALEPHRSPDAS